MAKKKIFYFSHGTHQLWRPILADIKTCKCVGLWIFMPVFGYGWSFTLWMLTVFWICIQKHSVKHAFRQTSIPSKRFARLYTNDWKSSEVKKSTFSSTLINVRCKFTINHHRSSLSPYIFESTYAITKYTNRQPLFSLSSYRNSWHSVNINHLLSNLHRYW